MPAPPGYWKTTKGRVKVVDNVIEASGGMLIYKVFCKNYRLRKGELMGMLIERRKDLRGLTKVESGLKWAKMAFGHMVKDKKAMFVVPSELRFGSDNRWLVEKGVFTREELPQIARLVDQKLNG